MQMIKVGNGDSTSTSKLLTHSPGRNPLRTGRFVQSMLRCSTEPWVSQVVAEPLTSLISARKNLNYVVTDDVKERYPTRFAV